MAMNMTPTNGTKPQDGQSMTADEREEAQLVRALEYLNVLHVWASELRGTIPRMTEPLKTARNSSELYAALMKSVDAAQTEVQSYQHLLEKGGYKQLVERANKSRKDNPVGIIPWDATEHPGWYEAGLTPKRRT